MSTTDLNQSVVWATADKYLRSIVEPEDYGDYILPLTVLRRLECILAPTKVKRPGFSSASFTALC